MIMHSDYNYLPELKYYETVNGYVLRKVLNHPDVKPFMYVNGDRILTTMTPSANTNLTIYCMRVNGAIAGLAFFDRCGNQAQVEDAFLPQYRGKIALLLGKCVLFEYTSKYKIRKLTGKIKRDNKRSKRFAAHLGFETVRCDENFYYVEQIWAI